MDVAFRADASRSLGGGHVMRCLALADELARAGASCRFACRDLQGHLRATIEARGHACVLLRAGDDTALTLAALPAHVDWLVVDHYGLDANWERSLRAKARRIFAIDDLADRDHDCDLLLDQNLRPDAGKGYAPRVPRGARLLLGPRYALLRRGLLEAAATRRPRRQVARVLASYGLSDPHGLCAKTLEAFAQLARPGIALDVVVGSEPTDALCEAATRVPGARLHGHVNDLTPLMAQADLALGAGGATTWERCLMALASLVVIAADNQRESVAHLESLGVLRSLGDARDVTSATLARAIESLLADADAVASMSERAAQVMEGAVGAPGVAAILAEDAWK